MLSDDFSHIFANTSAYEFLDIGVSLLAAIATFILGVIAVWPQLERWIWPLTLNLTLRSPKTFKESFDGGTRCVNLDVKNVYPKVETAKNVVVYVTRIRKFTESVFDKEFMTGRVPIKWQFNDCLWPKEEQHIPRPVDIGPERVADLLFIQRSYSISGQAKGVPAMLIRNHFAVSDFPGVMTGNTHLQISLAAIGDNVGSNELTLEIKWNGEWSDSDDEMQNHLSVEVISAS